MGMLTGGGGEGGGPSVQMLTVPTSGQVARAKAGERTEMHRPIRNGAPVSHDHDQKSGQQAETNQHPPPLNKYVS